MKVFGTSRLASVAKPVSAVAHQAPFVRCSIHRQPSPAQHQPRCATTHTVVVPRAIPAPAGLAALLSRPRKTRSRSGAQGIFLTFD